MTHFALPGQVVGVDPTSVQRDEQVRAAVSVGDR